MSPVDTPFFVDVDTDTRTVTPHGDIDMATAAEFRRAIQQLESSGQGEITVDLSHVDFIDSSGVGVLISAWEQSRQLVVRGATAQAVRVFALTGVDHVLPIAGATGAAIGAVTD